MKNLRLKKLYVCSESEKAAQIVQFDQSQTVILGENDTGKSCLIKSIYAAFGADPAKFNDKWRALKTDLLMEFTVDKKSYSILRSGNLFGLFDAKGSKIWAGTNIVSGIGPVIAELLDFKLTLANRKGLQTTPPPAFCFLPFYVDQDAGWLNTWSSFAGLQMFPRYKQDVAFFHAGLRPNEYYQAKADKLAADSAKEESKKDRKALDRAAERLKAGRKPLRFDLKPEDFGDRVNALLAKCQAVRERQDEVQRGLAELHSKRAVLFEQVDVAKRTLAALDADYEFLRDTTDAEIACPTCGTIHENDFANKFGLISDADACRSFVVEINKQLEELELQVAREQLKFNNFASEISEIESMLDEAHGDMKLRDLIEGESERLVDTAIGSERSSIDQVIGEQDALADQALETMKSYDKKEFQKPIKDRYFGLMKSYVNELKVPNLDEKNYKRIDCSINETGSDLPRAQLAYYYAFVHTMQGNKGSGLCPLVIDTPVQQDQDLDNAARIIKFALEHVPKGTQLILGTVSLHGVEYGGHVFETTRKYHLLDEKLYDEAQDTMSPLFLEMLKKSD